MSRTNTSHLVAPVVAFCGCTRRYNHLSWCKLRFLGIVPGEADDRFDIRACKCGRQMTRPLPADVSVCMRCFGWAGRRKTVTWFGVICAECSLWETAVGRLRCVG